MTSYESESESARGGLYLNIKKTKQKSCAEVIHNFNIDNEDIKIVKDFLYRCSLINSNGACRQEIERRLSWKISRRRSRKDR